MVYLPTLLYMFMVNVGKYTIHGCYGQCYGFAVHQFFSNGFSPRPIAFCEHLLSTNPEPCLS